MRSSKTRDFTPLGQSALPWVWFHVCLMRRIENLSGSSSHRSDLSVCEFPTEFVGNSCSEQLEVGTDVLFIAIACLLSFLIHLRTWFTVFKISSCAPPMSTEFDGCVQQIIIATPAHHLSGTCMVVVATTCGLNTMALPASTMICRLRPCPFPSRTCWILVQLRFRHRISTIVSDSWT